MEERLRGEALGKRERLSVGEGDGESKGKLFKILKSPRSILIEIFSVEGVKEKKLL